jgi:hypothetical protein
MAFMLNRMFGTVLAMFGPPWVTSFGGNDELVAVACKIFGEHSSDRALDRRSKCWQLQATSATAPKEYLTIVCSRGEIRHLRFPA